MIRHRHGKTPYELLHDKPPDLSYLHVFGALCYPTNDCENVGKEHPKLILVFSIRYAPTKESIFRNSNRLPKRIMKPFHVDFDELTRDGTEHNSSGPALHEMTPSLNPSTNVDLQAPEVIAPIPEAIAPEHAVSTGSPSSTTVDQDAPSPSNSHTTQDTQTPIISHDVEEENHDIEVAHMGNDPYFGIPIPEVTSDQSSSSDQSTPKNYKEAITQAFWIEASKKNFVNEMNVLRGFGNLFLLLDKAICFALIKEQVENGVIETLLSQYGISIGDIFTKALWAEKRIELLNHQL
ncbi:hypothetical protein Tco_0755307 [Tanacetum coccineum]